MEGGGVYNGEKDMGNLKATELRLGLPGSEEEIEKPVVNRKSKRALPEGDEESEYKRSSSEEDLSPVTGHRETEPVSKAQVVGWPPVRSYRKNSLKAMKEGESGGLYVKVSMDGAPYLRKIDLKVYKGYKELKQALEHMFKCFSLGEVSSEIEEYNPYEYAITYEDKDGDWMLVGDVPWGMFINSCKRLRIMKGSEARGLTSNA
ncbi:AUX/IAA protein [Dioscorea alata]|uniref:AUX/IAA protein n=1 Tax=Dioscorea alata TaxID=55571 RepID=A0ACB7UZ26_DIOAL|nr:AUX/IAA protein [Dioscorea alata]